MAKKDVSRSPRRDQPASRTSPPRRLLPSFSLHRHQEPEPRLNVELNDLDSTRESFTLRVRPGLPISKFESFLRGRTKSPIPEEAAVLFYIDGRELRQGSVVRNSETIFFRVLTGHESHSLRISLPPNRDDEDPPSLDDLVQDIEAGLTVGALRARLASILHVADAKCIVVTAWGGTRPGPLEGEAWEVRQVRSWLCRCLMVQVYPERSYLTIKGLGREYIYHPAYTDESHAVVRAVKIWIHARIATGVRQRGTSTLDLKRRQVRLTHDGDELEGFSHIFWGSVVEFKLPDDAAEAFSDDESWLLPVTETCMVCCDDKRVTEMPLRITAACGHSPTLCKSCLQHWIQSSLDDLSWDRLKCPECPELLKFEDVKRFAASDVFERYDRLATRAALKEMRNFRWCLGANCESGQIHAADCPKFKCHTCSARHCIIHEIPWHSGETCDEYDERNRRRRKDEKKSEKMVKEISKQCPECKKDVHKYSGCNHITCVCGHEWCYICFAPYYNTNQGILRCQHNAGCTERDILADLGFVPGMAPPPLFQRAGRFRPPPPPPPPGARPRPPPPVNPFVGAVPFPPRPRFATPGAGAGIHVPPVAPVPPFFADPPPRVREEMMENTRRRRNTMTTLVDTAITIAAVAAAAAASTADNGRLNRIDFAQQLRDLRL